MTPTEKRAAAACETILRGGKHPFSVVWKKSRTWGTVPSVLFHGEKVASATGCGYDKLSGCVAMFLRHLVPEVARFHGSGIRGVERCLAVHGWKLKQTYDGIAEDGFEIQRR